MKKGASKTVLLASQAGMELCWLQAWGAFLLFAPFRYHLPLLFVLFIYGCGILTNGFCYSRPRLRIQVFLLKAIILPAAFITATHLFLLRFNDNALPLQLTRLFSFQKPIADWGLTIVLLLIAGITWRRSTIHIQRPVHMENVYNRLDLGIGAFFALMVLKLILYARFDVIITYPDLKTLFLPFFVFGLLTIGALLSSEENDRQYASGFQKLGVALSFVGMMLAGGLGILLLFQAQMRTSAEMLSGILKKAGPPLEGAVIWLGRLLFVSKRHHETPSPPKIHDPNLFAPTVKGPVESGWLSGFFEWGAVVLLLLAFLFLLFVLGRFLYRFLLSGTDSAHIRYGAFDLPRWLRRLWSLTRRIFIRFFALAKGTESAKELFRSLVSWGRRSGIVYQTTETPKEYGARLSAAFPRLKADIETIVHLIYQETYGESRLDGQDMAAGKKAKNRMAHPAFWKDRLKCWLLFPEKPAGSKEPASSPKW